MPGAARAPLETAQAPQETPREARGVQCSRFAPRIQGAVCAGLQVQYVPKTLLEQDIIIDNG